MSLTREFGSVRHLVVRFVGALSPAGPVPADESWALAQLLPGEQALWHRMAGPDRRHAVGVARDALARLEAAAGGSPGREVAASALLHDVGKVEAHLGTFARVAATLVAVVAGRRRLAEVATAAGATTWRGRFALYLAHDRAGGELLRAAGSDPLTIAWAEQHHLDPARWSVDPRVGAALKAADGD